MRRFSLYYGYEGSVIAHRANNRRIKPSANTIFAPQSASIYSSKEGVTNSYFYLFPGIGFIGMKYHIAPQLSVGLESAAGLAYFIARHHYEDENTSKTSGFVAYIDPSRQFNLEYYF